MFKTHGWFAFVISMSAVASAATVTVDNKDNGFTILLGSWNLRNLPESTPWPTDGTGDYLFAYTVTGTATANVEWRPSLPSTGTYTVYVWYGQGTNRANNATYTIYHAGGSTPVAVNQQTNGGQWNSIGQFTFNAGTSGYVQLSNRGQASKVVVADAVQFVETVPSYNLTMAASPAGAGTTTPAVGGPYPRSQGELVNISASASAGYAFDHWEVSGGSAVASPTSAITTVTMDQAKTVTAVFVTTERKLTMAVSPAGAGLTTPVPGGPYPAQVNDVINISAAPAPGFVFDHWDASNGSAVAEPGSASTTVNMDVNKTVTAVFACSAPTLTMAVTPAGAGSTTPASGVPDTHTPNQTVGISAQANAGFVFDHWSVTAGAAVQDLTSANTTVNMDQSKTLIAVFKSTQPVPGEIRAFWAVAFQDGYKTADQVDAMVQAAVNGNYNVIIAQMLAYQDSKVDVDAHGAYWNSNIVPKATDIVPSDFDPLAYLCERAHANGIEVHAMSVPFRMCTSWPPAGNDFLKARPHWFSVSQANMGCITPVPLSNGIIVLDPGNPEVQDYLLGIMREWLTNYPIDGVHWDLEYVAGGYYPTNVNTPNSTLARFKQITGYEGTPDTTYAPWQDFRRRVNTEIVRRVHAEILGFCTPTRQIRQSASLIAYGDAEANFSDSEAYKEFNDWELWTRMGYLDTAIPMNYDREHNATNAQYFRNYVNQEMIWKNNRELVPGLANYLNYFTGTLAQMNYCRSVGTEGISSYDYWYTRTNGTDPVSDMTWYTSPTAVRSIFTAPAPVRKMPWRDPLTATEGTLWGRVTDPTTGAGIDNATVQVGSLEPVETDGNGYYAVAMSKATSAGTSYAITAGKRGYPTITHSDVQVLAGSVRRHDIVLGCANAPSIPFDSQPQPQAVCVGATAVFTVSATGCGDTLTYKWQKNGVDLLQNARYAGITAQTLTITDVNVSDSGQYRCVVSDIAGSTSSNEASLSVRTISPADFNNDCAVDGSDAAIFFSCASGPGALYNAGALPAGCTLPPDGQGKIAADFDRDGDVDQSDFGVFQVSLTSPGE